MFEVLWGYLAIDSCFRLILRQLIERLVQYPSFLAVHGLLSRLATVAHNLPYVCALQYSTTMVHSYLLVPVETDQRYYT